MQLNAILALADNSVFRGRIIAAISSRCGEIVFNTGHDRLRGNPHRPVFAFRSEPQPA